MSDDVEQQRLQRTLLGSDDAMLWATEFCRIFDGKIVVRDEFNHTEPGPVDPGTMVSWFANAMQVAIDMNRTREIHAAGGLTDTEEFLQRWEAEHPEGEEPEPELDESTQGLADALERDERDEMERRQEEFLEGFNEGRPV